jgi:hypothetical protein
MQYRGRVKGEEANNACPVAAHLYAGGSSRGRGSGTLRVVRAGRVDASGTYGELAAGCSRPAHAA